MKILHIIGGGDVGGAKTHVLSLLKCLSASTQVRLVSLRQGPFSEEAIAAGIPTTVISSSNFFIIVREIVKIVKSEGCDILHCHGSKANVAGVFLKWRLGLPVITTVHSDYRYDYMGNFFKRWTNGILNTIAVRLLDYRICVSGIFTDLLICRGFNPQKLFTIFNSLDFSDSGPFARRAQDAKRKAFLEQHGLTFNPGTVIIGIAVRFHPVKDVSTLIRAFAIAVKTNPDLRLLIGGSGSQPYEKQEEDKLHRLVTELNLQDKTAFTGWVSDMNGFLSMVDIDTLVSLSEGFPYSVLEGIKSGCAMVCSRVGAIPSIIDHGVNGLIFQPGDVQELALCLLRLASDSGLRRSFCESLYAKARSLYSLDTMTATQENIYRTVLRRSIRKKRFSDGVVICGAYGYNNTGDEAILDSIITEMYEIDPDMPIKVISRNPEVTRRTVHTRSIYTFSLFRLAHALLRSRLYINGGGTLMQDKTSTKSLMYYLSTIVLSRLVHTPVMLYGSGIGPVSRPFNRKITGFVLNRFANVITLRDEASLQDLKNMKVTRPVIELTADPTLMLSPADNDRVLAVFHEEDIPPDGNYICFSLRSWHGIEDQYDNIARAADRAYVQFGLTPIFLSMTRPVDIRSAKEVVKRLSVPHFTISQDHTAREIIGMIGRMKMLVGMRLHSLIFAVSQGVPVVGISYDIKVDSFLRYAGIYNYIPLLAVTEERLFDMISCAISERPALDLSNITDRAKQNLKYARLLIEKGMINNQAN